MREEYVTREEYQKLEKRVERLETRREKDSGMSLFDKFMTFGPLVLVSLSLIVSLAVLIIRLFR